MTFNPQDFVQAMAMDLAAEAPEEVRAAIFTDQRLRLSEWNASITRSRSRS